MLPMRARGLWAQLVLCGRDSLNEAEAGPERKEEEQERDEQGSPPWIPETLPLNACSQRNSKRLSLTSQIELSRRASPRGLWVYTRALI